MQNWMIDKAVREISKLSPAQRRDVLGHLIGQFPDQWIHDVQEIARGVLSGRGAPAESATNNVGRPAPERVTIGSMLNVEVSR